MNCCYVVLLTSTSRRGVDDMTAWSNVGLNWTETGWVAWEQGPPEEPRHHSRESIGQSNDRGAAPSETPEVGQTLPIWSWLTDDRHPPGSSVDRESHSWRQIQDGALKIDNQSPNPRWRNMTSHTMYVCAKKDTERCMFHKKELTFNLRTDCMIEKKHKIGCMCYRGIYVLSYSHPFNIKWWSTLGQFQDLCRHPIPRFHNNCSESLKCHQSNSRQKFWKSGNVWSQRCPLDIYEDKPSSYVGAYPHSWTFFLHQKTEN